MSESIAIKAWHADRLEEVFDVVQLAGLHSNMTFSAFSDWLNWACLSNPYRGNRIPGRVAMTETRIVGFQCYIYQPLYVGDWEGIAANVSDTCVLPAHQGLLGMRLVKTCFNSNVSEAIICTHANRWGESLWQRYGGWSCPDTRTAFIGWLHARYRWQAILRERMPGFLANIGATLGALVLPLPPAVLRARSSPRQLRVIDPEFDFGDIEGLLDNAQRRYNVGIRRDRKYLDWRYLRHPKAKSYRLCVLSELDKKTIDAVLVIQLRENAEARLCECLIEPRACSEDVALAFCREASELGAKRVCWLSVNEGFDRTLDGAIRMNKEHSPLVIHSPTLAPSAIRTLFAYGEMKTVD